MVCMVPQLILSNFERNYKIYLMIFVMETVFIHPPVTSDRDKKNDLL